MTRGLSARVARLENICGAECPVCHGCAGASHVFIDRGDGVCRDANGRALPDGPDVWTCAGCGSAYVRPRVVIWVVGRSKSPYSVGDGARGAA